MRTLYIIMTLACLITMFAIVAPSRLSGTARNEVAAATVADELPIALAEMPDIVASDGCVLPDRMRHTSFVAGPELTASERDRAVRRYNEMLVEADHVAPSAADAPAPPKARAARRGDTDGSSWSRTSRHSRSAYKAARYARATEKARPNFYGQSRHARERLFATPVTHRSTSRRIHSVSR